MVAIALKREYSNLYPSGWTVTGEDKQGRKDNLNSDTPLKPVRPSSAAKAQGSETPDNPEASQKSASVFHSIQRRSPSATPKPPAKEYSTEYPQDWTLPLASASLASTPSTQRRAKEFGQFDTNGPPPAKRQVTGPSTGGGWGIRTPEGFHPTRFPSVRHRPLGESSWTARERWPSRILPGGCSGSRRMKGGPVIQWARLPAWRHPGQLPQSGNAARVTGLWRVRGESFQFLPAQRAPLDHPRKRRIARPEWRGRYN